MTITLKNEVEIKELSELINVLKNIRSELDDIKKLLTQPAHPTSLRLIFNKHKSKKMETIEIGKLLEGTLELFDDVTGQPVDGETFDGDEVTSSDESIFTVAVNPSDSSKLDFTGVGVGEATAHVKTNVTYTNSKGKTVTESKEADSDTISVELGPDGTSLRVTFPSA